MDDVLRLANFNSIKVRLELVFIDAIVGQELISIP